MGSSDDDGDGPAGYRVHKTYPNGAKVYKGKNKDEISIRPNGSWIHWSGGKGGQLAEGSSKGSLAKYMKSPKFKESMSHVDKHRDRNRQLNKISRDNKNMSPLQRRMLRDNLRYKFVREDTNKEPFKRYED